jgi:integrase
MGLYKPKGCKVWWMNFTDRNKQVRRSTETPNKKLAEKIYAKSITQVAEGKWFEVDEGRSRTFKELAEKYESQVFKELKNWGSAMSYLNQLKDFFGPYTLYEITPALIDDFKQMRKAKGVKPATINRQLTIFKRIFNLAKKRWMWIRDVPPIEMEPKADKKRVRYLTFKEYRRVLECCDDWLKNIVAVAAWTGLRLSNVVYLRRSQLNMADRTILLDGSETKNQENLIIPVAAPALEALKNALKVTYMKSPYVFCENDSPSNKRNVQRDFKKALKLAGIEDFRFHDLRHCFASWNRQAGVDIDTLADLMGHKDTRMTRRYAHITPAHLSRAVGLLEKSYSEFIMILSQSKEEGTTQ